MKHKLLADDGGERTFILVLDEGDEAFGCITAFAEEEGVTAASITAIGAFRVATISRSPSHRMLARRFRDAQVDAGGRPVAAFPSRLSLLCIDKIFIGECISASRTFDHDTPFARRAVDHLPLCADLEIA